jgi:hypothetical protein
MNLDFGLEETGVRSQQSLDEISEYRSQESE